MCGIVGLFLKNPRLEPLLGQLIAPMLAVMSDRGPDSAGFAVYGAEKPGHLRLTVRGDIVIDAEDMRDALRRAGVGDPHVEVHATHAAISVPAATKEAALAAVTALGLELVSIGKRMEIYKEVGLPETVAARFGLAGMSGTHAIGHTRMATESAVTTKGAHPFTTGLDQCLVHNGSLSNHNAWRRLLQREGVSFATDNDSEVAAAYLSWRMARGSSLGEALKNALEDLDGFYTFVIGAERGFGVLRDPIACKPAVMAETDDYVAFGSEYRALVELPGVEHARVWEPEPATPYFWERAA
ncbi:MAG: glutamine amidotransferase family protein [Hyphomonadaceae bacterium]